MQHIRVTELEDGREVAQPHQKEKGAPEGPGARPPDPHRSTNKGLAEELGIRGQMWDGTGSTHAAC